MSINGALQSAITGLRISQAGLDVVAQNVASANQPGYTRKVLQQSTQIVDNRVIGLRSQGTVRTVDNLLQSSLRTESAGGKFTNITAQYADRLNQLFGTPGDAASLDAVLNQFTNALQQLATSPENAVSQSQVVDRANVLVQQVRSISDQIQSLRLESEQGINDAVQRANDALQRISQLDQQISAAASSSQEPSDLLDARDQAINELANIVDIRVQDRSDRSVSIFTRSGVSLFDRQPVTLSFDPRATITPQQSYDIDPTRRGVGTITLTSVGGLSVDLVAQSAFRSGEIAAYLNLRDRILPEAQAQLDNFAAGLAEATSEKSIAGTAITTAGGAGFSLDVSQLRPGDHLSVSVNVGGAVRNVTVVRVDDASKLPLSDTATANPNDEVIGIGFSGGNSAAAAALQTALQAKFGTGVSVTNPPGSPNVLEVVSNGSAATTITAASALVTETSLAGGTTALPLFVDGGNANQIFSDSLDDAPQRRGFAQRFAINGAVGADPSTLVKFSSTTGAGDPARPNAILDAITRNVRTFVPAGSIGSATAPASGTLTNYLQRIVADKGQIAATAQSIDSGQQIVVNGLQNRFDAGAKVNTDEELSNLIQLQQTYQASARILTVVRDLTQALLNA